MKQKLLTMLCLLALTTGFTTRAQEAAQWCLVVESAAGETIAIGADLKPTLTATATGYELSYGDQHATFAWNELKQLTIKETKADANLTPVRETKSDAAICIKRGQIAISGAEAGTLAAVYSANGTRIAQARVSADGTVNLSTSQLPSGIYIIKTNRSTFKIKK